MTVVVELNEMVEGLWRRRNAFFDGIGCDGHEEREAELRQYLWDNKTGICAMLSDGRAALAAAGRVAGEDERTQGWNAAIEAVCNWHRERARECFSIAEVNQDNDLGDDSTTRAADHQIDADELATLAKAQGRDIDAAFDAVLASAGPTTDEAADAALAYAIWDSENTVKMAASAIEEHITRAQSVRRWLRIHGHDVAALALLALLADQRGER